MIADGGSVQNIPQIPAEMKARYKTVWEISQKTLLDMSADRGAYICQSQSFNVHMGAPTTGKLTSMHFYAWKKGLKTGMYYLRTQPKAAAIQFTVDQAALVKNKTANEGLEKATKVVPGPASPLRDIKQKPRGNGLETLDDEEVCLSCGA